MRLGWHSVICMWLLACAVVLAGVRVCPRCGYENPDGPTRCTHCDAVLPAAESERKPSPPPPPRPTRGDVVNADVVVAELRMAQNYYKKGRFELAYRFARNAMALDQVSDRAVDPGRSAAIADLVEHCRKRTRQLSRTCPECNGTGRSTVRMQGLDGGLRERTAHSRTCTSCRGAGAVLEDATVAETKQAKGRALRTYKTLQQGRQYVAVGNAWIPAPVRETLTTEQTAVLLTATASPCPDCFGIGREDCDECRGGGRVACPERDCKNGRIRVKREGTLVNGTITQQVKCPSCGGRGWIACEECGGSGTLLCEECQGTGERDMCRKCNGAGYVPCRRCGGDGKDRGVMCEECGGEGVVLCRGCRGDGRDQ